MYIGSQHLIQNAWSCYSWRGNPKELFWTKVTLD